MLTYYTDPGHGWLRVTLTDLANLNMMAGDFSQYSYRQGNYVYLEEDCDAGKFIDAYKEKHGHEPEMCHIHTDHDSLIRALPRITPVRTHRAPPPVFREFAIAICELLLEHEWPADVTQAITDVLAAVRSGDTARIYRAADAARVAADAAANAAANAAHAAAGAAARAADAAGVAAYAHAAARAAAYAQVALPAQKDRVHAIVLMLT